MLFVQTSEYPHALVESRREGSRFLGYNSLCIYTAVGEAAQPYAIIERGSPARQSAPRALERDAHCYDGPLVNQMGAADNDHGYIQVVAFNVPLPWRQQIDAWYDEEHLEMLMRAPDWLRASRMRVESCVGPTFTSVAIHELRTLEVMNSPERAAARSTVWRSRFSSQPWFEGSGRWLYRRI